MSQVLIFAEVRRGKLAPTTFELLSLGRQAAEHAKQPLNAVLIGSSVANFAQELIDAGANKVYVIEHAAFENFLDESYAKALAELAGKEKPSRIFFPSSTTGKSLAGRLAVLIGAGAIADITEASFEGANGTTKLQATRPCYGGNILATVACQKDAPEIVTVRAMVFPRTEKQAGRTGETVKVALNPESWNVRAKFVQYIAEETKEIDIGAAEKVVSGGRGLGQAEGFSAIRDLAHALGAAVGASRAAVDAGWIPYRHQVGLTGRVVRPKLYVACGISGQVQHLAGMGQSEVIVAINKDPECPMMKVANYSIEADLYQFIPLVVKEIQKHKH